MKKKLFIILLLIGFLGMNFLGLEKELRAQDEGYKIVVGLPGAPKGTEIKDPSQYIGILFKVGLGIAGILALIVLLYSAILYSISAGNIEKQAEAKSRIFSAFLGLGLLLFTYLILYTINPELVALKLPQIKVNPKPVPEFFPAEPGTVKEGGEVKVGGKEWYCFWRCSEAPGKCKGEETPIPGKCGLEPTQECKVFGGPGFWTCCCYKRP